MQALKENVKDLPGVAAVGFSGRHPLSFHDQQWGALPEGYHPPPNAPNSPSMDCRFVDEGYFQAMGIPILQERGFAITDDAKAPGVLVINQAFAQRFWPGQNPIGKRVRTGGETISGSLQSDEFQPA